MKIEGINKKYIKKSKFQVGTHCIRTCTLEVQDSGGHARGDRDLKSKFANFHLR
jgi:hypothetical protein